MQAYPGGPAEFQKAQVAHKQAVEARAKEIWPNFEGPTTRDVALGKAIVALAYSNTAYVANANQGGMKTVAPAPRPSESKMPVWQGTPEENLLMMRAAFSLVGLGPAIGAGILDEKSRKFVWEYTGVAFTGGTPTGGGRRIVFEDNISEMYYSSDPATIHIPSSQKNVLVTRNLSCDEVLRRLFK